MNFSANLVYYMGIYKSILSYRAKYTPNPQRSIKQTIKTNKHRSAEAKYGIIFKTFFFFVSLVQFSKIKNTINLNSLFSSIIKTLFELKFSPIWVCSKRNVKESMIWLTQKPSQSFFVYCIQSKEFFFFFFFFLQKTNFLRKRESGGLNKKKKTKNKKQKRKVGFLTVLATAIKKDPSTSIRKHANELKVLEKTVRTPIKQNLSPDFNPFDYAIWGVLENKTCNFSSKYWFA